MQREWLKYHSLLFLPYWTRGQTGVVVLEWKKCDFNIKGIKSLQSRINTGRIVGGEVGHFLGTRCQGSEIIENRSFNLGEFYVKMGKTNRNL